MPEAIPAGEPGQDESRHPYSVHWSTDIEPGTAGSPYDAARAALEVQRDPESIATHFTVTDPGGRRWHVDLLALPGEEVTEIPVPAEAGAGSAAPETGRFSLDTARAEDWLRLASPGAGRSETASAGGMLPEGAEPPGIEIDDAWDPRIQGRQAGADLLVQDAVRSGVIESPDGWGLFFDSDDALSDSRYWILVREKNGPLTLASDAGRMDEIGEDETSESVTAGVPVALAVLEEAVASANAVLGHLDSCIARHVLSPRPRHLQDPRDRVRLLTGTAVTPGCAKRGAPPRHAVPAEDPSPAAPDRSGPARGSRSIPRAGSASHHPPGGPGRPGPGARP